MVAVSRVLLLSSALLAFGWRPAAANDLTGTRSIGMGGTLRAAAAGVASPLLNPALMSLSRMYVLGATYQYRGSDSGSLLNAAVVDSVTTRLAAGISYSFGHATPIRTLALDGGKSYTLEQTLTTHQISLSLSYPLGDMFALGLSGRYVNHKGTTPPDMPAGTGVEPPDISAFTMDIGGVLRLGQAINVAVVGYNLIHVDNQLFYRSLGFGVSATLAEIFLLEFDSVLAFGRDPERSVTASFHGGVEAFFARRVAVRAGAMYDMFRRGAYVTGGLGLVTQRLGLEFGLRQMVTSGAETMLAFSLQVFGN